MASSCVSFELGNNWCLTAGFYEGRRIIHIRLFDVDKDGKKFPTKTGVSMNAVRFAAFVYKLDAIDSAYKYVAEMGAGDMGVVTTRVVHIGARLYASVTGGYKCVHLRYFFKTPDDKVLPSRNGITLTIPVWQNLRIFAKELHTTQPDLNSTEMCMYGADHANQLGFLMCDECNPFHKDYQSVISYPPTYNPLLDFVVKQEVN
jgi:hypothetical protein